MSAAKFTWGETAVVSMSAPVEFRPGSIVSIIGVFTGSEIEKMTYREFEDDVVYSVEFDDGSAMDIEQRWLAARH